MTHVKWKNLRRRRRRRRRRGDSQRKPCSSLFSTAYSPSCHLLSFLCIMQNNLTLQAAGNLMCASQRVNINSTMMSSSKYLLDERFTGSIICKIYD
jgi:hypothetical protein